MPRSSRGGLWDPKGALGGPLDVPWGPSAAKSVKNNWFLILLRTGYEQSLGWAWRPEDPARPQGEPKVGLRGHYGKPWVRLGMSCAEMYSLCSVLEGPTGKQSD